MEDFHPTDTEMLALLLHKVSKKPLPIDNSFPTQDVYADQELWEIFKNGKKHYFYAQLKRRGSAFYHRNVGKKGVWEKLCSPISILDSKNREVGCLNKFRYKNKNDKDRNGEWYMKEYTLSSDYDFLVGVEYSDYAFCFVTNDRSVYLRRGHPPVKELAEWNAEGLLCMMLKGNGGTPAFVPANPNLD